MSDLIPERLLSLLACPDCRAHVVTDHQQLRCVKCARTFEVRDGIPLLHARNTNPEHIKIEGDMVMEAARAFGLTTHGPRANKRAAHEAAQWRQSKEEFWRMFTRFLRPEDAIIYIGCGLDASATEFERQGHFVVHVDLVYENVSQLRTAHGAQACVAGDLCYLPFKPGSFDCATCVDVIHHEYDHVPDSLRSVRDLLRSGGRLLLQEPNAWGMFQFYKSMLLPRPVHKMLRSAYHRLVRPRHKPADYEFPTSPSAVIGELRRLGFVDIRMHPNDAYPFVGPLRHRIYRCLGGVEWVRRYHNYHYMLSAVKPVL